MATVNFSVPEGVKQKFNKMFAGQNKSRIMTDLMARAVEEREAQKRRVKAIDGLLKLRGKKSGFSDEELRAAREHGRP